LGGGVGRIKINWIESCYKKYYKYKEIIRRERERERLNEQYISDTKSKSRFLACQNYVAN